MYEFLCIGDMHLAFGVQCPIGRHPESFDSEQKAKLSFIKGYAIANGVKHISLAGDLFNYKNPSLYTANAINGLMSELVSFSEGLLVTSIAGNHDLKMSSRQMKSASVYNIFQSSGVFEDIAHRTIRVSDKVTFSGLDYHSDLRELLKELRELDGRLFKDDINVVVVHEHFMPDGDSLPFSSFLNYSKLLEFENFDVIHAGHLHLGFETGRVSSVDLNDVENSVVVVNPWSMSRLARDHYALGGTHTPELVHVKVSDCGVITCEHVKIPCEPFDTCFIKEDLKGVEKVQIDVSEFVSSLEGFEVGTDAVCTSGLSLSVSERVEHYMALAGDHLASGKF